MIISDHCTVLLFVGVEVVTKSGSSAPSVDGIVLNFCNHSRSSYCHEQSGCEATAHVLQCDHIC